MSQKDSRPATSNNAASVLAATVLSAIFFITAVFALPVYGASLDLGWAVAEPGGSVSMPLSLNGGDNLAALSTDIVCKSGLLTNPRVEIGPAADAAGKVIYSNMLSSGIFRIGIIGFNLNEIADGVVATVTFDVQSERCIGRHLVIKNTPAASDSGGNLVKLKGTNGVVVIKPPPAEK